jgi:hypothetical protein
VFGAERQPLSEVIALAPDGVLTLETQQPRRHELPQPIVGDKFSRRLVGASTSLLVDGSLPPVCAN